LNLNRKRLNEKIHLSLPAITHGRRVVKRVRRVWRIDTGGRGCQLASLLPAVRWGSSRESGESGESTLEEGEANLRPFFLLSDGESSGESGESGESTLEDGDANLRPFFLLSDGESSRESGEVDVDKDAE
jgi:hypothetical protein